ncbi:hypothetical protein D7S86_27595 [Pararobbsia silviterrae]|uniref:Uncharacterized protein n=1 Tax=Pararobbsia silviterrae TaxID=1792498 RepID=A0A494X282_9BURK|nr:hypothetical protein D7S86_27595 [Pararobbsia silviterrae]
MPALYQRHARTGSGFAGLSSPLASRERDIQGMRPRILAHFVVQTTCIRRLTRRIPASLG